MDNLWTTLQVCYNQDMCKNLKQNYLKANVDIESKIRRENYQGIEHLVVPVIAAKEMVMNGYYYPAEEFSDWVETWNGVPVPISHPQVNGVAISAKAPRIQELNSVGWFFNAEFTPDNKLKGEIWINLNKVAKLNANYLIESFESGEIVEVSTGLFSNVEMVSGEFNGVGYEGIIRHIRPDHLALLPNEVGACSIEDGCGAMRNNSCQCKEPKTVIDKVNKALKLIGDKLGLNVNKSSFSEIIDKVRDELMIEYSDPNTYIYILDIYDNEVIYGVSMENKDTLYKRSYVHTDNQVKIGDDTQEVIRKTIYKPVISENKLKINGGITPMDKEKLIQSVITNKTNAFTEEDKESLEGLSDDVLTKMVANTEEEEVETNGESKEESQEETTETPEPSSESSEGSDKDPATELPTEQTTDQKVNTLLEKVVDSDVKEILSNAVKEYTEKKQVLVNTIVKESELTEEEVKSLTFNQIQKLANSFKKSDYTGRGTVSVNTEKKYEPASVFNSIIKDKEGK